MKSKTEILSTYQLRIAIKGTSPLVWRLIEVPSNISYHKLHYILQLAFGWSNCEDYEFSVLGYNICKHPYHDFHASVDSETIQLSNLICSRLEKFNYTYNLFSNWLHIIRVDQILPFQSPIVKCIDGKNACPLEDIGGVLGHNNLLRAFASKDNQFRKQLEWVEDGFNPYFFNLSLTNDKLQNLDGYIFDWESMNTKVEK